MASFARDGCVEGTTSGVGAVRIAGLSVSNATNLPENHRATIAIDLQAGVPTGLPNKGRPGPVDEIQKKTGLTGCG
jgi:hypothetical protein